MSRVSDADVIAPTRTPTCPTRSFGSQWTAKMRSTPSRAPKSMTSGAPPTMTSSAGWKMKRSGTGNGRVFWYSAMATAVASVITVWKSWPHACMTPSLTLA